MREFILSEKMYKSCSCRRNFGHFHFVDVKEFIRLLKEELCLVDKNKEYAGIEGQMVKIIDKLAGEKLC